MNMLVQHGPRLNYLNRIFIYKTSNNDGMQEIFSGNKSKTLFLTVCGEIGDWKDTLSGVVNEGHSQTLFPNWKQICAIKFAFDLISGVKELHSLSIIHSDISLANIGFNNKWKQMKTDIELRLHSIRFIPIIGRLELLDFNNSFILNEPDNITRCYKRGYYPQTGSEEDEKFKDFKAATIVICQIVYLLHEENRSMYSIIEELNQEQVDSNLRKKSVERLDKLGCKLEWVDRLTKMESLPSDYFLSDLLKLMKISLEEKP